MNFFLAETMASCLACIMLSGTSTGIEPFRYFGGINYSKVHSIPLGHKCACALSHSDEEMYLTGLG